MPPENITIFGKEWFDVLGWFYQFSHLQLCFPNHGARPPRRSQKGAQEDALSYQEKRKRPITDDSVFCIVEYVKPLVPAIAFGSDRKRQILIGDSLKSDYRENNPTDDKNLENQANRQDFL